MVNIRRSVSEGIFLGIIGLLCLVLLFFFLPTALAAEEVNCFDQSRSITHEEQRITEGAPIPQQILQESKFDQFVDKFIKDLCSAPNLKNAENKITSQGENLWKTAVDRAQGKRSNLGELDRYDDRPLYWARLHMTRALRQWTPEFDLSDTEREKLIKQLEYTSRGITNIDFPSGNGVKRILVTGFDPYQLQNETRRSNPSGASALQLDGLRIQTDDGPAFIQAAMLPVRWEDFEDGIVEDVFAPFIMEGKQQLDLMMTISQGGARQMAIEGYAGRWQTGSDNNLLNRSQGIPVVEHWPMPDVLPEFIETTLPYEAMIEAGTGPWRVHRNDRVCELLPPDFTQQVCHSNGPSEGSQARSGGGGAYLSNESQYRSNRVRLGLGQYDMPGGHLHIASLEFYPQDRSIYIDDDFQNHRMVTVDQTVELVKAAARAVGK